jgi:D-alanine--poly(phosphoribitol) ligase subunit 2
VKDKVLEIVSEIIDELNALASDDQQLEKELDAPLYGGMGKLDSLGLVNVMVSVEQKAKDEFGVVIDVANEKAISQENSPFKTVGSLVNYIEKLVKEKQNS